MKGLARLKSLIRGKSVKRQSASALRCMQTLTRLQSQVHERRAKMSDENQTIQREMQLRHEKELEKLQAAVSKSLLMFWCNIFYIAYNDFHCGIPQMCHASYTSFSLLVNAFSFKLMIMFNWLILDELIFSIQLEFLKIIFHLKNRKNVKAYKLTMMWLCLCCLN